MHFARRAIQIDVLNAAALLKIARSQVSPCRDGRRARYQKARIHQQSTNIEDQRCVSLRDNHHVSVAPSTIGVEAIPDSFGCVDLGDGGASVSRFGDGEIPKRPAPTTNPIYAKTALTDCCWPLGYSNSTASAQPKSESSTMPRITRKRIWSRLAR